MKKFLSLLLAALCCISLIAFAVSCGNNESTPPPQSDTEADSSYESSESKETDTESSDEQTPPSESDDPSSEDVVPSNEDIVVEIAKAYDRKGGKIPYDQHYARRSLYSSPEDATAQRTIFLDCSSYVNSCYREGFGVNILPFEIAQKSPNTQNFDEYAKNNQGKSDVIGYWIPSEYKTEGERTALVDGICEELQVGDILTYRHGKTSGTKGHTYIYIGNNTFMHCAGVGSYVVNSSDPSLSYDSKATETNGTIETITANTIFRNTSHNRYLFKSTSSDTVFSFGIIRPFARGLTPTEESLNRMKIAGLSMEKTSSICENAAVLKGMQLTYSITLVNTGAALSDVVITDTLPSGTVFVSGDRGVTVTDGKLSWVGNVLGKTTVRVSYTVEITAEVGSLIVSDETYVSGVKLGCITHSVSSLTEAQLGMIAQTAKGYVNSGTDFDNTLAMIKLTYGMHGIALFDTNSASEALDMLIDKENLTRHTDTALSDMIAPNLYGGLSIKDGWHFKASENDKTRLPKEEHLCIGDIILADWSGGSTVYLYVGDHTLLTVENGVCKKLTIGDNIFVEGENIIISLLGYDRYAVIRPSMRNIKTSEIVSIAVTKQPNKLNYDIGEVFDSTGMVVTATLSDQTQMVLSSYVVSPDVLTAGTTFVTVSFGGKTAKVNVNVSSKQYAYSIEEASKLDVGEAVLVEGIVVGVAHEGLKNDSELLVKDVNDDTVIAVRNTGGSLDNIFGYQIGDRIVFKATVKNDTSSSTCYKFKKYLEFSKENVSAVNTIVSRGNEVSYTFEDAVEIDSWEDAKKFFVKSTNSPYTYLKITGGFYLCLYRGSDPTDNFRFHMNADATTSEGATSDGISITFRDDAMKANLGAAWKDILSLEESMTYPGTFVEKDIYALYIGGNKSYYQLVILDDSWVM